MGDATMLDGLDGRAGERRLPKRAAPERFDAGYDRGGQLGVGAGADVAAFLRADMEATIAKQSSVMRDRTAYWKKR